MHAYRNEKDTVPNAVTHQEKNKKNLHKNREQETRIHYESIFDTENGRK